ncbi:TrmB family transcriptional regulator [Halobacteriales archaeon Cl-PHB]
MAPESTAVDALLELGFTEYEAGCLVALVRAGTATAADVSDHSNVPRSRVYDVADGLAEEGYVEVMDGEPRRYRALPPDRVVDRLEETFQAQVATLGETLETLHDSAETGSAGNVWSLSGRHQVLVRSQDLIDDAAAEVTMLVSDDLLIDDCIDCLRAAADRDVDLDLLAESAELRDWLDAQLPSATVRERPEVWSAVGNDGRLARLIVADGTGALVATKHRDGPTDQGTFEGVVGEGAANSLVLALQGTLASLD